MTYCTSMLNGGISKKVLNQIKEINKYKLGFSTKPEQQIKTYYDTLQKDLITLTQILHKYFQQPVFKYKHTLDAFY